MTNTWTKMASILVVDDSDSVTQKMSSELTNLGHSVMTSYNGLDALNLVEKHHFDIAFIDLYMSIMDGLGFCTQLHERQMANRPKIVIVTSDLKVETRAKFKDLDIVCWISKPIPFEQLEEIINQVMDVP